MNNTFRNFTAILVVVAAFAPAFYAASQITSGIA